MNQVLLDLEPLPTARPARAAPEGDSAQRTGFQIGWDHARHGLVPPAEWLEGTALGQGWRAGKAVQVGRTLPAPWVTRQWLALRVQAWREGAIFDPVRLSAVRLARLHGTHCPITRAVLGGPAGSPEAPVVVRLDPIGGYTPGNVAVISTAAARAREGLGTLEILRRAHRVQAGEPVGAGLDFGAWMRLAALRAFATPLPFHEAARVPLALLPPSGVVPVNAVQHLQWLLTRQFSTAGWSSRTRTIAQCLPAHTARQDFHLFIGALAPRVMEAGGSIHALEDAWLHERVQRRWQHVVLSLGEAGVEALLERVQRGVIRTAEPRFPGSGASARRPHSPAADFSSPGRVPASPRAGHRPAACP